MNIFLESCSLLFLLRKVLPHLHFMLTYNMFEKKKDKILIIYSNFIREKNCYTVAGHYMHTFLGI
jgi:hypothetical protein